MSLPALSFRAALPLGRLLAARKLLRALVPWPCPSRHHGGTCSTGSRSSTRLVSAAAAAPQATASAATAQYDVLSQAQRQQIDAYLDLLLETNRHMNLTAITDRQECMERHVLDSLALLPVLDACLRQQQEEEAGSSGQPFSSGGSGDGRQPSGSSSSSGGSSSSVIDVGTGAGLPGVILAIARPSWRVTLLDSLQKRCRFLEQAAAAAGLQNVSVQWARAEDAGQSPALREQFHIAVARAVAETRLLAEYCLPLVRLGGHWVAAKGPAPQAEVAAAANALGQCGAGGRKPEVVPVDSWSADGQRCAVVVQKTKATPARYPRKPGVPAKRPL